MTIAERIAATKQRLSDAVRARRSLYWECRPTPDALIQEQVVLRKTLDALVEAVTVLLDVAAARE